MQTVLKNFTRKLLYFFFMGFIGAATGLEGKPLPARPVLLFWVIVEKDQSTHWVGNDSLSVATEIKKVFNQHGMPCLLPLLDLADIAAVSEQDIATQNIASLEKGSRRYHPDVIVLGQLKEKGSWEGQWTVLRASQPSKFSVKGQDLPAVLNETAEHLVKLLKPGFFAKQDKPEAQEPKKINTTGQLWVSISGIGDGEQYGKALQYLGRLPMVKAVEVSEILPEKTVFELRTTVDQESLAHAISEDHFLMENPDFSLQGDLSYKISGGW